MPRGRAPPRTEQALLLEPVRRRERPVRPVAHRTVGKQIGDGEFVRSEARIGVGDSHAIIGAWEHDEHEFAHGDGVYTTAAVVDMCAEEIHSTGRADKRDVIVGIALMGLHRAIKQRSIPTNSVLRFRGSLRADARNFRDKRVARLG